MDNAPEEKQEGRDSTFDRQIREALERGLRQQTDAGAAATGARVRVMAQGRARLSLLRREIAGVLGHASRKDVYDFCRQLAILLECGMPVVRALNTLANRLSNYTMAQIAQSMGSAIEEGSSFTDAVRQHSRQFPGLAINMIRAGEASGNLIGALNRVADQGERMESAKSKAVTMLIYPAIVIVVAGGVISFAFSFLLKTLEATLGQELGKATGLMSVMLKIGRVISSGAFWVWVVVIVAGLIIAYLVGRRFVAFRLVRDRILIHVPLVRLFMRESLVSQFGRVFAMLLQSGVPVVEALEAARETTSNEVMRLTVDRVAVAVREGRRLAPEFDKAGVFPPLVCDIVAVGEEAGSMDHVFERVADVYDRRLEEHAARLGAIVQPVIVVLLACVVGAVAVSLFKFYANLLSGLAENTTKGL